MKFANVKLNLASLFLSAATIFSLSSCSDDDNNNISSSDNPYALSLAIQGSDNSFTYYTVPFADVMTGTLSAAGQGIEQPGYYDFTKIDNTIYSLGGLDDVNVVAITQNEDSSLNQVGDVSFSTAIADIVKGDDNTLISVSMRSSSDLITFRKFNPNTVAVNGTVDVNVSDVMEVTDVTGPNYSGMVVSGDHLFLSYYVSNSETYNTDNTEQAEIAVFSYPELEFEKVITDNRVGPIGGFNTRTGLIKDESGNIYALSHSNPANGYSQSTKPGGVLKINAGETEFDDDYFLDIPALTDGKQASHLKYLGNGKVFAEINMADRDNQEKWSDGPLQSAVIDLETSSVNFINNVPEHKGDGRRIAALQEGQYVYLCIPVTDDGIYVYKMDTENYTAEKGAKVEANFIAGFFKF
ncbi:hypothetical protein FHR24_000882 [Wenyingzhuangia heitensis]|uniref:DUF4374 domain-containing protein n=1 Tax=Wenyingzhuangia heitensis TaxID=1487859 RepID=A0ABX0U6H1_9FLAO|nr:DUF4374 domain-containing protein [Wenyingzhuangia heitensis]NIJ44443.1 hypothetical protein [Wenyingzhuangia heitensis]